MTEYIRCVCTSLQYLLLADIVVENSLLKICNFVNAPRCYFMSYIGIYSIIIICDSSSSSSSYVHIYHDDKHIIKHKYRMYDVRILSGNHNVRGVLRSITAVPAAAFVSSSNVPIQIKIYNNRHWLSVKTENFLLYGDSSPITVRIEIHCIILLPI